MNVLLIGCTGIGALHASMIRRCGLTIKVCADARAEAAGDLAKQLNAEATTDALGAIKRADIDIVAICAPTPFHADFVIAAAQAGKHIFCEKPFALSVARCREAAAAARKARVKLFVGHVVRYFQDFEVMRAQCASGAIGEPGYIKLSRGGIFPGGEGSWFRDYTKSGGVTLDCSIHDLDWIRYAFGEPERIYSSEIRKGGAQPINYAQMTMRMKSGMLANVIGTWAHPFGFRVTGEICGSAGMLTYDSQDVPLSHYPRQAEGPAPTMIVPANPVDKSPYQLEWEDFLAWILEDRAPRVTPDDATRAVEIALAALRSAETGQPVKL